MGVLAEWYSRGKVLFLDRIVEKAVDLIACVTLTKLKRAKGNLSTTTCALTIQVGRDLDARSAGF